MVARGSFLILLFTAPLALRWWPSGSPGNVAGLPAGAIHASDLPLLATLISWGAAHLLDPRSQLRIGPKPLVGMLFGIAALATASIAWAAAPVLAMETALRIFLLACLAAIVADLRPSPRAAAWALGAGAALNAVPAGGQFLFQHPLGLNLWGEPDWSPAAPEGWIRGYGLTPHPNILGIFAAVGSIALLGALRPSGWKAQGLVLSLMALNAAALAASFSRTAWLTTLVGWTVASSFLTRRVLGLATVTAGGVFILFVAAFPDLYATRTIAIIAARDGLSAPKPEIEDIEQRAAGYTDALAFIRERPLTGVGSGSYVVARLHRDRAAGLAEILPVHNTLLLIAAELGIVGPLLLGGAYAWVAVATVRRWRDLRGGWTVVWATALAATLIAGMFDFYFWGWENGRILLWSLFGLWAAAFSSEAGSGKDNQAADSKRTAG